jgi:2-phosphosulfolactate phosphatase
MIVQRTSLQDCHNATGTVVVIDVLRAFTTAAFAFAADVKDIILVSTVEQAFELRRQRPDVLLMGEVNGLPIPGYDLSNSPSALVNLDLSGRHLVQRTSAGTQGVIRSTNADTLLTTSFVCATATAHFIKALQPTSVTFVLTGLRTAGWGDEDAACADYLEALLLGKKPNPQPYLQRVRHSPPGQLFSNPTQADFNQSDLDLCLQIDRFDFAMFVEQLNGQFLMKALR